MFLFFPELVGSFPGVFGKGPAAVADGLGKLFGVMQKEAHALAAGAPFLKDQLRPYARGGILAGAFDLINQRFHIVNGAALLYAAGSVFHREQGVGGTQG